MRKQLLFLFLTIIGTGVIQGQIKSTKIGYIDMEYILQNVSTGIASIPSVLKILILNKLKLFLKTMYR
jgi:Skp family chaperone for outer membrane proteins